ncbi:hypothetical protein JOM56_013639 [Amanita muscaria]
MPEPKRQTEKDRRTFKDSLVNRWILLGWTKRSDDELKQQFEGIIRVFGDYKLLTNNCRVFLSHALQILDPAITHPLFIALIRPNGGIILLPLKMLVMVPLNIFFLPWLYLYDDLMATFADGYTISVPHFVERLLMYDLRPEAIHNRLLRYCGMALGPSTA